MREGVSVIYIRCLATAGTHHVVSEIAGGNLSINILLCTTNAIYVCWYEPMNFRGPGISGLAACSSPIKGAGVGVCPEC